MVMRIPVVRIEGNIGAGKSTALRHLTNDNLHMTVCEPVDGWTCHLNGLYASRTPEAWCLPMQAIAMCTRAEAIVKALESISGASDEERQVSGCYKGRPLVVERSCTSANIFAYATLLGDDVGAFETLSKRYNIAIADAFRATNAYEAATIYLRTSPSTCTDRICSRSRQSENRISKAYLQNIHDRHEALFASTADLVVDCDKVSSAQVARTVQEFLDSSWP